MLASALSLLSGGGASAAQQARYHKNAFPPGERLDLRVYLSERPRFRDFNNTEPIWHVSGLLHANDAPQQSTTVQVPVTGHLIANGSLFAHAFITREGRSPDPAATGSYDPWATTTLTQALVVHGARPEPLGLRKLTTGEPAPWEEELRRGAVAAAIAGQPPDRWVPHWKPALHLSLIVDFEPHELFRGMPPHYQHHLLQRRLMDRDGTYKPLLYSNELTVMRQHWLAINDSAVSPTELPLELSWSPMGVKRFAWMQQLEASFKMNEDKLGARRTCVRPARPDSPRAEAFRAAHRHQREGVGGHARDVRAHAARAALHDDGRLSRPPPLRRPFQSDLSLTRPRHILDMSLTCPTGPRLPERPLLLARHGDDGRRDTSQKPRHSREGDIAERAPWEAAEVWRREAVRGRGLVPTRGAAPHRPLLARAPPQPGDGAGGAPLPH